jgi:GDP-L-fucose synthase
LEETNEPYAIAKIAGIKLCENYRRQFGCDFISAMPTNLYGPNDSYDLNNSHVLPALLRRFHEAKMSNSPVVEVWGSGKPLREFLHVEDLANACLFLMQNYNGFEFVNIGSGQEISISDLSSLIKEIVGFTGSIVFDRSKPDGTPRKLLDRKKMESLDWRCQIALADGIKSMYSRWL